MSQITARIIDGKAEAARLRVGLREQATALVERLGGPPKLCVIIIGSDPASRIYVRTKTRMAAEVGIEGTLVELPQDTTTAALLAQIDALNRDPRTHGILVQLPLPAHIDAGAIIGAIAPHKDVDGFHPLNVGRLSAAGRELPADLLVPCTPWGCVHLLRGHLGVDGMVGCNAVVVGRSNIVGKPMAALLLGADCTVTMAHSRTRHLADVCRRADILIAAVGRPEMIRADWVRPGATVIDVGINRVIDADGDSRLVGDVSQAEVAEVAGALTPVPGGVGPMTVACLLRNTLIAARNMSAHRHNIAP